MTATGQNLYAYSSRNEQDSSSESSAAKDVLHHGTGVPPLRLFAPPGILANGGRKADELEELDEEPELSELKVVETEFIEAGAKLPQVVSLRTSGAMISALPSSPR